MYRKLVNKVPIDEKLYRLDEVKGHITRGGQIGWLVEDGYIVIDVDDFEESEILVRMLDSNTNIAYRCHGTKKGKHFIFKLGNNKIKQGVKLHTPVAIKVDTRTSGKGFIVMPFNDPDREILKNTDMETLSVIPKWLIPLRINVSNENFIKGVGEANSGRNDALLRQVFRLKGSLLKPESIAESIKLIDTYYFKKPLGIEELVKTVIRPELLSLELQLKENKFSKADMAEEIMDRYNIRYISQGYYMYNNGVYKPCLQDLERITLEMYRDISDSQRRETLSHLRIMTAYEEEKYDDNYVNVFNGIYDLKRKELLPHSPTVANRTQVCFTYNPEIKIIEVDTFLLNIADSKKDRVKLLLQMIGYCLTRSVREQKMFFLYGESANNGKSTLLKVIMALVGNRNLSSVALDDISKNRFMTAELDNKILNVYADLSAGFLEDTSKIKNLVTGDQIQAEKKGKDTFKLDNFAKFLFSANELPKASKDMGWYRRMVIIPFSRNFGDGGHFDEASVMHQDALDYLGTISLKAYEELYHLPATSKTKWANSTETEEYLNRYKEETDSVLAFTNQFTINSNQCKKRQNELLFLKSSLYNEYIDFCDDGHQKPKSKVSFGKSVRATLRDTVFNNAHYWILEEKMVYTLEKNNVNTTKHLPKKEVVS